MENQTIKFNETKAKFYNKGLRKTRQKTKHKYILNNNLYNKYVIIMSSAPSQPPNLANNKNICSTSPRYMVSVSLDELLPLAFTFSYFNSINCTF